MTHPKKLLTTNEAAQFLGVSKQTLAKWRCAGGPDNAAPGYVKLGRRRVMYELDALLAFIESRKFGSTSEYP